MSSTLADGLLAAHFLKAPDGKRVFFPNGPLLSRRGWIVPDSSVENRLRRHVTWRYGLNFLAFVLLSWPLSLWGKSPYSMLWLLVLCIPDAIASRIVLRGTISRLERSTFRPSFHEVRQAQAKAIGVGPLVGGVALGVALIGCAVWIVMTERRYWPLAMASATMGALFCIGYTHFLCLKHEDRSRFREALAPHDT